jgi:hypothetical protein
MKIMILSDTLILRMTYIVHKCLRVAFLLNPHETSFVLVGMPRGLKDLLHMLNAIVFRTTIEIK